MPALYRMPVFYLLVLFGALAYGVGVGLSPLPVVSPPEPPEDRPPPIRVVTKEEDEKPATDGILRTADGLRRKVVVKDLAVVCRSEPNGGRVVGRPLDYFAIRYLYGEEPAGQPERFQVGPKGGPPQGWVPASAVLEWDTRLMARPTPRGGRPRLAIYQEQSCLVDALAARPCPRHKAGQCPLEGEEPAEDPGSSGEGPPLGFPILSSKSVEGQVIHEVASLVQDRASAPILPTEPPPDLRRYLKVVYVAFAIDTTASMQSTIEASRKLASDLVASASKRFADVRLKFALVEYRDADRRYGFKGRTVTTFTGAEGFLASLNRTNAATRGDGSVDEAVLDGVALALPPMAGDPPGEHVDWPTGRAGELATKLLVLLGDAPDHAKDLDRAKALADRAKEAGITIATVAIDRPGVLSRDEQARYRDQWRTLAEGSYRPLDKDSGFTQPLPPVAASLREGDRIADRLQALIDDRVEHARTIAAIATAEAEGRLGEYVNSQGLTLDRVAPVLVDLHRGDAAKVARPDPRFDGRKAPSVRQGWLAESIGGKAMVEVDILMSRDELKELVNELLQLQGAASGTANDLAEMIQIGRAAASGETGFLAADRGSRTFAEHLRRQRELPPARPGSLLARSQSALLKSDDLSLAALSARLRASLLILTRRTQDPDWDDDRRTIDKMALVPFEAIDF